MRAKNTFLAECLLPVLPALLLFAAMLAMPAALAATAGGSMSASATISATCAVGSSSLNFGAFNPTSNAALTANGTVTITCTSGTPYNVGLDAGAGSGATTTSRKMTSGPNALTYQVFRDSGYSQNWGQTVGTDTVSGTGSGTAQSITAYGRIPAQTSAPPGNYSDTIGVTITY